MVAADGKASRAPRSRLYLCGAHWVLGDDAKPGRRSADHDARSSWPPDEPVNARPRWLGDRAVLRLSRPSLARAARSAQRDPCWSRRLPRTDGARPYRDIGETAL